MAEMNDSYIFESGVTPDISYNSDFNVDFTKKFKDIAESVRLTPLHKTSNYDVELKKLQDFLLPKIQSVLEEKKAIKFHLTLFALFHRENTSPLQFAELHLDAKSRLCMGADDVNDILTSLMNEFRERIETKLQLASNFIFDKMIHVDFIVMDYRPVRGLGYIPVPDYLKRFTKCLTNIQNRDSLCIVYCVLAKMFPQKHRNKKSPRNYLPNWTKINSMGLEMKNKTKSEMVNDAKILERDNDFLSINIFIPEHELKTIVPYRLSQRTKYSFDKLGKCTVNENLVEVDLLMISDGNVQNGQNAQRFHYVLIANFNSFISQLNSKAHSIRVVCKRCINTFANEEKLMKHMECCMQTNAQLCRLPEEGSKYKFCSPQKSLVKSFTLYYDFECFEGKTQGCQNQPLDEDFVPPYDWMRFENELKHAQFCQLCTKSAPCTTIRPLQKTSIQIPYAFGLYVSCIRPDLHSFPVHIECFDAEDGLLDKFLSICRNYCIELNRVVRNNTSMILTDEDMIKIKNTKTCKYCGISVNSAVFHRDHDHLSVRNE